jgi:hypothetical protein
MGADVMCINNGSSIARARANDAQRDAERRAVTGSGQAAETESARPLQQKSSCAIFVMLPKHINFFAFGDCPPTKRTKV